MIECETCAGTGVKPGMYGETCHHDENCKREVGIITTVYKSNFQSNAVAKYLESRGIDLNDWGKVEHDKHS